jgi:hypothetical protein
MIYELQGYLLFTQHNWDAHIRIHGEFWRVVAIKCNHDLVSHMAKILLRGLKGT